MALLVTAQSYDSSMPAIREIVIDANDADMLAAFWAAALGYELLGAAGNYRALKDPSGGPMLIIQQVPDEKIMKNRVHFDLEAADIRTEAVRLEQLGASILNSRCPIQEHKTQWMVLADPEGNEFCICQIGAVPNDDNGYPAP